MSALHTVASVARRSVPAPAVPTLVRARTRRALRDPDEMATARHHMGFLLGTARLRFDLEAAARRYVAWTKWRGEARLHDEIVSRPQRFEGLDHLLRCTNGALVSFVHHGQYDGAFAAYERAGLRLDVIFRQASLAPDAPEFIRRHLEVVARHAHVFGTDEGMAGIVERLHQGRLVAVGSDIAGSTPVRFVGRDLRVASGVARAAFTTGKPVVVVTAHHDGDGDEFQPFLRAHPPLLPPDFGDHRALLQLLLTIHEAAVLDWPEAYESPATYWGHPADADNPGPEVTKA